MKEYYHALRKAGSGKKNSFYIDYLASFDGCLCKGAIAAVMPWGTKKAADQNIAVDDHAKFKMTLKKIGRAKRISILSCRTPEQGHGQK